MESDIDISNIDDSAIEKHRIIIENKTIRGLESAREAARALYARAARAAAINPPHKRVGRGVHRISAGVGST
ncbi:hypothetical protein EVAR_82361_1 [Eumeta japonica]|uniref:Uncharacterized protein n=1 Tax=Eumeta variegata TaxID=151549 RepID=A0A4C1UB92_EUMVA|nr:hypothetical protein EVAR_82361_1 [Eumeta japonica]